MKHEEVQAGVVNQFVISRAAGHQALIVRVG